MWFGEERGKHKQNLERRVTALPIFAVQDFRSYLNCRRSTQSILRHLRSILVNCGASKFLFWALVTLWRNCEVQARSLNLMVSHHGNARRTQLRQKPMVRSAPLTAFGWRPRHRCGMREPGMEYGRVRIGKSVLVVDN